jgi:hypothetical protein
MTSDRLSICAAVGPWFLFRRLLTGIPRISSCPAAVNFYGNQALACGRFLTGYARLGSVLLAEKRAEQVNWIGFPVAASEGCGCVIELHITLYDLVRHLSTWWVFCESNHTQGNVRCRAVIVSRLARIRSVYTSLVVVRISFLSRLSGRERLLSPQVVLLNPFPFGGRRSGYLRSSSLISICVIAIL